MLAIRMSAFEPMSLGSVTKARRVEVGERSRRRESVSRTSCRVGERDGLRACMRLVGDGSRIGFTNGLVVDAMVVVVTARRGTGAGVLPLRSLYDDQLLVWAARHTAKLDGDFSIK